MKRSEIIFSLFQIPLDFFMIVIAGSMAYLLRFSDVITRRWPIFFELPFFQFLGFLLVVSTFSLLFFALAGLYQLKVTRSLVYEIFLVVLAVTSGVVAMALWVFLTAQPFESRLIIFFWWIQALVFVSLARVLLKKIQQYMLVRQGIGHVHLDR